MKYFAISALMYSASGLNVGQGTREPCEYEDTGFGCVIISRHSLFGPYGCEPIPEDMFFDAGCRSWSHLSQT